MNRSKWSFQIKFENSLALETRVTAVHPSGRRGGKNEEEELLKKILARWQQDLEELEKTKFCIAY